MPGCTNRVGMHRIYIEEIASRTSRLVLMQWEDYFQPMWLNVLQTNHRLILKPGVHM